MEEVVEMTLRASGEDYLKAVLVLTKRIGRIRAIDVAGYLGFAKTSVSHGLRLLRENGFLARDEEGYIYLTETGLEEAEKIYARHCFFTRWLTGAGIDPETAVRDACRMDHAISEESFRQLTDALERVQKAPEDNGEDGK